MAGTRGGRAPSERATPFRSVALATQLPRSLRGDAGALALRSLDRFEVRTPTQTAQTQRGFESLYGDEPPTGVPKSVLVPYESEDLATYEEWLCHLRGSRVQIRVPQRGDKRALLETVTRNAGEAFTYVHGKGKVLFVDNVYDKDHNRGPGDTLARALTEEGINLETVTVDPSSCSIAV